MENLLTLLTKYRQRQVHLSLGKDGESLSVKGDLKGLSAADKAELKTHKEALLAFFKEQKAAKQLITPAEPTAEAFPLSPNQQTIWMHQLMDPESLLYVIPVVYAHTVPGLQPDRV
ncbi:MAG TPA: hypothetical protein DCE41_19055, partial [Cytophagales bacterium]|nr:hypothetical protein [Cytophagales bacterium]